MKTKILILLTFFVNTYCFSQFSEQLIISTEANGARGVYAADIDGDGDIDVIGAAESDDKVAWYENLDGLGNFSSQNIITQNLNAAVDVFAADLDGDNDVDILVASKGHNQQEGKVVWYKNMDGLGTFTNQALLISELTLGAVSVFAIDLDGDEDLDVLSASFLDNKVAWYKNDGIGNFGSQQIITNIASSTRDVYAADLDGDGDMDVLSVSTATDKVIWFENMDGLGNFGTEKIINSNTNGPISVYAVDIDGDGDMDVLSNSPGENKVFWYENMDGLGNFGSENVISQDIIFPYDIYSADLDNDGDMDVLASSSNGDKVVWYENLNGLGSFGAEQIISTNTDLARSVYAIDIDNDGDMDVLSASKIDNKIAWYKNLTPLGIEDNVSLKIVLYPNPARTILNIENTTNTSIQNIKVLDVLGRLVLEQNNSSNQIDLSNISSGLLFVQIETDKGELTKKIIKE